LLALFPQYEEDRNVLTLNESQTWAVIGTFAAGLFGMLGFVLTAIQRTIRTEIGSVRTEIGSVRSQLGSEISSLRQEMGVRFDSLSGRIDHLDRDVQFLMKRELEDRA
jgi:hypothetical protein